MPHHLTLQEREVLSQMRFAQKPLQEIARRLERSRSTIYRELVRNSGAGGYSAVEAQGKAEERRCHRPRKPKMEHPELNEYVRLGLVRGWSPDQIAGRSRVDFPQERQRQVSRPTIYRWIAEQGDERKYWEQFLRFGGHRRRDEDKRGHLPRAVSIAGRPAIVAQRKRFGDWEGDTVVGKGRRGALLTLVERKSGYLLAAKVGNLRARTVRRAATRRLQPAPASLKHTLTFDHGKEFAEHVQLARQTGLDVFFAAPYCAWQRGTNENTNGLVREYFPKGTAVAEVSHYEVARIQSTLNDRPRRRLGYKTPREVLTRYFPDAFET